MYCANPRPTDFDQWDNCSHLKLSECAVRRPDGNRSIINAIFYIVKSCQSCCLMPPWQTVYSHQKVENRFIKRSKAPSTVGDDNRYAAKRILNQHQDPCGLFSQPIFDRELRLWCNVQVSPVLQPGARDLGSLVNWSRRLSTGRTGLKTSDRNVTYLITCFR